MFFNLSFIWIEEPGYKCPQDYDKHVDTKMPLSYGDNTVEGFMYITEKAELKSRLVWKYCYNNEGETSWLESWHDQPPENPDVEYGTHFGIMLPDTARWVIHEDCYHDIILQILDDEPENPEDPHPDNDRPKFKALGIGPRKKSSYLMHYDSNGLGFVATHQYWYYVKNKPQYEKRWYENDIEILDKILKEDYYEANNATPENFLALKTGVFDKPMSKVLAERLANYVNCRLTDRRANL
jgi:hypothetical protein